MEVEVRCWDKELNGEKKFKINTETKIFGFWYDKFVEFRRGKKCMYYHYVGNCGFQELPFRFWSDWIAGLEFIIFDFTEDESKVIEVYPPGYVPSDYEHPTVKWSKVSKRSYHVIIYENHSEVPLREGWKYIWIRRGGSIWASK